MRKTSLRETIVAHIMVIVVILSLVFSSVSAIKVKADAYSERNFIDITIDVKYDQTEARRMLDIINEFRHSEDAWYWNSDNEKYYPENLNDFVYDYGLEKIAMQRAAEASIWFSHGRPGPVSSLKISEELGFDKEIVWSENIASCLLSAEEAYMQLREDDRPYGQQGHRKSMLMKYTAIGIAFATVGDAVICVQEFGSKTDYPASEPLDDVVEMTLPVWDKLISSPSYYYYDLKLREGDTVSLDEIHPSILFTESWHAPIYQGTPVKNPITFISADNKHISMNGNEITGLERGCGTIKASMLGIEYEIPLYVYPKLVTEPTSTPTPSQYITEIPITTETPTTSETPSSPATPAAITIEIPENSQNITPGASEIPSDSQNNSTVETHVQPSISEVPAQNENIASPSPSGQDQAQETTGKNQAQESSNQDQTPISSEDVQITDDNTTPQPVSAPVSQPVSNPVVVNTPVNTVPISGNTGTNEYSNEQPSSQMTPVIVTVSDKTSNTKETPDKTSNTTGNKDTKDHTNPVLEQKPEPKTIVKTNADGSVTETIYTKTQNSIEILIKDSLSDNEIQASVSYAGTNSNKIALTSVETGSKSFTIPKFIKVGNKKYYITTIDSRALKNSCVTNLTIGSRVTTIKKYAFKGNRKIKTVNISAKNLKSIETGAFSKLSSKVRFVIKGSSEDCERVKKLILDSGVSKKARFELKIS